MSAAVALQLYDLDKTGDIQPGEVKRLLVALLNSNPDIALDERVIAQIVDQVSRRFICCSRCALPHATCSQRSQGRRRRVHLCFLAAVADI